MKKLVKWALVPVLLFALFGCTGLVSDKMSLHDDLIRLHVVANSDSQEDQALKLQVRDAIASWLEPAMQTMTDKEQAHAYILKNLNELESTANQVLQKQGSSDQATVTLTQEEFGVRHYDTFSLPSGIYDSLRIEIGDASGQNWWCVVFPSLCLPAAADFQDTAVASGFDEDLSKTLTREAGYEIRFFLLDCLGWLENFFHKG